MANWKVSPKGTPEELEAMGSGGYFPFGVQGTLQAAAHCFIGFVGFELLAATNERMQKPRSTMPRSLFLTLFLVFLCYLAVATAVTLAKPYYQLDAYAAVSLLFKRPGMLYSVWLLSLGGILILLVTVLNLFHYIPRLWLFLADDKLIFPFLGQVSRRTRNPVLGTLVASFLAGKFDTKLSPIKLKFTFVIPGAFAGFFDLAQLVSMLSVGTLIAYTFVAFSVTLVRWVDASSFDYSVFPMVLLRFMDGSSCCSQENFQDSSTDSAFLTSSGVRLSCGAIMKQLFNGHRLKRPNRLSTVVVRILLFVFCK